MHRDEGAVSVYRSQLDGAGLGAFADVLVALALPSIRLIADSAATVADRSTRLGGLPALPESTPWPHRGDAPLSFLAQVDLADVADHEAESLLPQDGLLSFFYDAVEQESWGFDPADSDAAAVIYSPAGVVTQLRPAPATLPSEGIFEAVALRLEVETTFAPWGSFDVEQVGMTPEQEDAYAELTEVQDGTMHRLLGHPDLIQGDMQLECQLVTHGLFCGDSTGYEDPRAKVLHAGASAWRLLLQLDSQDDAGMMWGDLGRLYFWIRDQDLRARAWESTWLILQCG